MANEDSLPSLDLTLFIYCSIWIRRRFRLVIAKLILSGKYFAPQITKLEKGLEASHWGPPEVFVKVDYFTAVLVFDNWAFLQTRQVGLA